MKEGGTKADGNTRKRKEKKKGREQKRRKRHYQEKEDGATEERTAPFIWSAGWTAPFIGYFFFVAFLYSLISALSFHLPNQLSAFDSSFTIRAPKLRQSDF